MSGTSTGKIVTVVNHSQTASLNISNAAITGDFSIASNGCGTILAAKASCAITIAFTPTTRGSRSGTLTLTDDAGTSPQGVALVGIGVIPVALSPATLDTWGTSGIFSTMVDGSLSFAQSMPFSIASSYWALPSGNSSHNNSPTTIPVTLRVHRFSDSTASVQGITDEVFVAIDYWRKKGIILNWRPQQILVESPCIDMAPDHCWETQRGGGSWPIFNEDNLSFVQNAQTEDTLLKTRNWPYFWKLATNYRARFPKRTGIDIFFLSTLAKVYNREAKASHFQRSNQHMTMMMEA